jgi:hypothetical protein
MKMKNKGRTTLAILLASAIALAAGYFVVNFVVKTQAAESSSSDVNPGATPLPAIPATGMAKMPSAGEPPVPEFSDEEEDEMDRLPVGNGSNSAEK